nr:hypothetical protein [Acidobacteriota bacterium]
GLVAQPVAAQWSIDLAGVAKREFQVPAGTETRIVVVNKAPNVRYHIVTVLRPIPVAPLEPVAISRAEDPLGCAELVQVAVDLQNATAETKVRLLMLQLQQALPAAGCSGTQLGFIRAVMASTIYVLPVEYVIRAGEELVVTVNRLKADNSVEKTWTLILTTGAQGSWRTLYGIALVPDRDDDPFLTPGDREGEFIVNAGASKDRQDFPVKPAPSVFFSWMSRSAEFGPLAVSPTLGVGATSELPGLFGGVSITYRQNLALVVGIPFVPQRHVKPQYINNKVVTSALTTADLTETKYHADKWFIGGVFRFSSNPFGEAKRPAQEQPSQEKPTATASGGR